MSEAGIDVNILIAAFNVAIAAINSILTYHNIRRSSRIAEYAQLIEIKKKSDILVKINTSRSIEVIDVLNKGELPMENITVEMRLSAKKGSEDIELGKVRFRRDYILRPEEEFQIPLYEKLRDMLQKSGLMKIYREEVPSGERDPLTGEEIFTTIHVRHILREYTLNVEIDLECKVFQEDLRISKLFALKYQFEPGFLEDTTSFRFAENYYIHSYEISGKWTGSSS